MKYLLSILLLALCGLTTAEQNANPEINRHYQDAEYQELSLIHI